MDPPGRIIRKPPVADFAGINSFTNTFDNITHTITLTFHIGVMWVGSPRPVFGKMWRGTVWPVQLIHINVVGLQPLQRVIQCHSNGFTADRTGVTNISQTTAGNLGH